MAECGLIVSNYSDKGTKKSNNMQSLSKTFVFFFAEPFYSCCAEQNDSSYHRLSMSAHTPFCVLIKSDQ